jgi:hypothetical protein
MARSLPTLAGMTKRVLLLMLLLCAPLYAQARAIDHGAADHGAVDHGAVDHGAFDAVLGAVVSEGRVDYPALKASHLPALRSYLDALAAADLAALPRDQRLAAYINLYNATVLYAVAERYRPGYSVAEDGFRLFKEPLVRTGGKTISLDELEKKIILPSFKDPRVHAVLVCAARSCPKLRQQAYTGQELDEQLDVAMSNWINDAHLNRIDPENRLMRISEVFKWYAGDFGGESALAAYVDRYHQADLAGYRIEYEPYDWALNER